MNNELHERRLHPRICLKDRGVTVIRPGMVMECRLADISLGGLAFIYAGTVDWRNSEARLDFIDGLLRLLNIRVRVASDQPVPRGVWAESGGPVWRRCGVEFLSLTEEEKADLARYLEEFSHG